MKKTLIPLIALLLLLMNTAPALAQNSGPGSWHEKYQEALEKYKDARLKLLEERKKVTEELRDQLRREIETEVEKEKDQNFTQTKTYILSGLDTMIANLEQTKSRIGSLEVENEELKTQILENLENDINYLNSLKQNVEGAGSPEALKNIGTEARVYWRENRVRVKQHAGFILSEKIDRVIIKITSLNEKLGTRVESEEMKQRLAESDAALSAAREKYQAALTVFNSIQDQDQANGLFQEGLALLKEARSELKKAYAIDREIIKELR